MARPSPRTSARRPAVSPGPEAGDMAESLRRRLLALTQRLDAADVSDKGIDMIKEIRELHALLCALRGETPPEPPPPLVVSWRDPAPPADSADTPAAEPVTPQAQP